MHPGAVRELARSREMGDLLNRAGEMVADNARDLAPGGPLNRASREGIAVVSVLTNESREAHIGHVARAYGFYLARLEFGTRYHSPRPHLRPAAGMPINL